MGNDTIAKKIAELPEEEIDNWFRSFWEEANETQLLTTEEADAEFIEQLEVPGALMTFLGDLAAHRGNKRYPPIVYATSLAAWKGRTPSDKALKSVMGVFRKNASTWRAIEAGISQDEDAIRQLQFEQDNVDQEVNGAERMQIAGETESLRDKLAMLRGDITSDQINSEMDEIDKKFIETRQQYEDEMNSYVQYVNKERKKADETLEAVKQEQGETVEGLEETIDSAQREAKLQTTFVRGVEREKKEQALKDLREKYKKSEQDRREKQRIREYIQKLSRQIMAPVSFKTVNFDQARAIEMIQDIIDPHFRAQRTIDKRKAIRTMLMDNRVNPLSLVEIDMGVVNKKALNEFTVQELEVLQNEVARLKEEGRAIMKARIAEIKARRYRIKNAMIAKLLQGAALEEVKAFGSKEWEKEQKRGRNFRLIDVEVSRPNRILRNFDNGDNGPFTRLIWNEFNNITDEVLRNEDRRRAVIKKDMETLGLSMKDFTRLLKAGGYTYSVQDAMYFHVGMRNEKTRAAILYGVLKLPENVVQDFIRQLTPEEKLFAERISIHFDEEYDRLREAYIRDTNNEIGKEVSYVPMYRKDVTGQNFAQEIMGEIARREALWKAFPDKKFTKARIKMKNEHQKPIRTDLVNLTFRAIELQEHYIASAEQVKDLQWIIYQEDFKASMRQGKGDEYLRWLHKYVNDFSAPVTLADRQNLDHLANRIQRNMGAAYLAFNLSTIIQQIPSLTLFLGHTGMNPVFLLTAAAEFVANPKKMIRETEVKDPQIKHRVIEPFLEAIKALRARGDQRIKNQITKMGFMPLEMVDKWIAVIGWNAVYKRCLPQGEAVAIRKAQDSVLSTQTAARMKDQAQIFRHNQKWLGFFTIFTNQMNQMWNIIAKDIPAALRQKQFNHFFGMATGLAICFIATSAISDVDIPDDIEEMLAFILEGALQTIPLVGKDIYSGMKGWTNTGVTPFKIAPVIGRMMKRIGEGQSIEEILMSAGMSGLEGTAVFYGLPYSAPKKVYRAVTEENPLELVGRVKD
jgi:hypothetical protein